MMSQVRAQAANGKTLRWCKVCYCSIDDTPSEAKICDKCFNWMHRLVKQRLEQMTQDPALKKTKEIYQAKIRSAKVRDIARGFYDPDNYITVHHLTSSTIAQGMMCAWCLVHMSLEKGQNQITVDRIDNNKQHSIYNVVMACHHCNMKRCKQ
jgi:hypothetical protein